MRNWNVAQSGVWLARESYAHPHVCDASRHVYSHAFHHFRDGNKTKRNKRKRKKKGRIGSKKERSSHGKKRSPSFFKYETSVEECLLRKKKTTSTSSSDAESYNFIDTYVYCVHPKLVYIFRVWWLNHSSSLFWQYNARPDSLWGIVVVAGRTFVFGRSVGRSVRKI